MYDLPTWVFWFFLIAGFASIGYSFFPRRSSSAAFYFILGVLSVGFSLFLWFSPLVTLR